MARLKKVSDKKNHRLAIAADCKNGELFLVRGGPRWTYLWAGNGVHCITISGYSVLRKLAYEILAELGNR
jgi:hypothetical protein